MSYLPSLLHSPAAVMGEALNNIHSLNLIKLPDVDAIVVHLRPVSMSESKLRSAGRFLMSQWISTECTLCLTFFNITWKQTFSVFLHFFPHQGPQVLLGCGSRCSIVCCTLEPHDPCILFVAFPSGLMVGNSLDVHNSLKENTFKASAPLLSRRIIPLIAPYFYSLGMLILQLQCSDKSTNLGFSGQPAVVKITHR